MIVFEIHDASQITAKGTDLVVAYLFYYERKKRFYVEIPDEMDEWNVPPMFYGHVKRNERSIGSVWSMKWVTQRIIPSERQNIGVILKQNGLKTYDEYKLLTLSEGRCAQDDCYIVRTNFENLPDDINRRLKKKVKDILPLSIYRLLVFFNDGCSRLIDMKELIGKDRLFGKILSDEALFSSAKVSPGGNGIEWDEDRAVSAEKLYNAGKPSDMIYDDVISFSQNRLADTTEVCDVLHCTRQYVNQLIKQGRLHPVISGNKTQIFAKAELERT